MTDVAGKVRVIVAEIMRVSPLSISRDDDLRQDVGVDSLDFIEILMAVEEHFDVSLDAVTYDSVTTLGSLISMVGEAVGKASA